MRRPLAIALLGAVTCTPAGDARAQHPALGAPAPRALHLQLAEADAVVIATVSEVELGRIRLVEAVAVTGEVPTQLSIKRAPSAPPPLAPGDRVLLPLRGARSPYLYAGPESDPIRLGDPSETEAWRAAIRGLRAAGSDGALLARAYARGLDAAAPSLRRQSAIGLAHPDCPASALPEAVVAPLVEQAVRARDPVLRRFAARAAVRTAAGRRALLARVPADDPLVLATALVAAAESEPRALDEALLRALDEALLRALRDARADIRGAGLRFAAGVASGDRRVLAQIVLIASEDPDPPLRELARNVMKSRAREID